MVLACLCGWWWLTARDPYRSWPELTELRELNESPTAGHRGPNNLLGSKEYRELFVPLFGNRENMLVRFSCGGGSNDYCHVTVTRQSTSAKPEIIMRFAGNCDVFWGKPRIWLEPMSPNKPRRFLTYHRYLLNDSGGGVEEGGYWLWVWTGKSYVPQRP